MCILADKDVGVLARFQQLCEMDVTLQASVSIFVIDLPISKGTDKKDGEGLWPKACMDRPRGMA